MKLSIVIPVYNAIDYLSDCLESILEQDFQDYEIVLVDDGSTDGSEKLCDEYADRYNSLCVVHQNNGGASSARNTGIRAAKGDYIHFVDSDDRLNGSTVYSKLFQALGTAEPDIVFSRRERYNESMSILEATQPTYFRDGFFEGDVLLDVLQNKYELVLTCPINKVIKRSIVVDNQLFFVEKLNHEEDEWLPRVIAKAKTCWYYNKVIYQVRHRKGSLSEIPDEQNRERKAESKVYIASTGVEYMIRENVASGTLPYIVEHYWGYMLDAVTTIERLKDKELKKQLTDTIRKYSAFFSKRRFLKNKNWRVLGMLFQIAGVRITAKILATRYKTD